MKLRLVVCTGLWLGLAGATIAGTLSPKLEDALLHMTPDELVPVVLMMERAPVDDALRSSLTGLNRAQRRTAAVAAYRRTAAESQAPVRALMATLADVSEPRVLFGINGLAFEASPASIRRLAAMTGVHRALLDRGGGHLDIQQTASGDGPNPDASIAPELTAMGAPEVWQQLGYTGVGVLVAIIDTGVDRTHPDLEDHIWTNPGEIPANGVDDDGNGYIDDTWGWEFCDDHNDPSIGSHGTQVAGQVAGDGTNGTVTGMAPDAELMALGIDCDTPSLSWAASDYAIAEGADIISQSYSWWWTDVPDYEVFRRQTDAELAAGVIHSQSAGNHGGNPLYPVPYNVSTPANVPAPWVHPDQVAGGVSSTIGVANISWSNDTIAASSSQGPSAWEEIQTHTDPAYPHSLPPEYLDYLHANGASPGLIKPDISAYGNGTTSTCPGPFYCGFSGTSSAQPHVAGTLALMLSANPEATPAELTEVLLTTAEHRGDPGKNNVYGVGLVQALPAVQTIETGVLYDSHTFDDGALGNGDLSLDPGERLTMSVTVRSVTSDAAIHDLHGVLTTSTPGVTIHESLATFPTLPALEIVTSDSPHFIFTVDPSICATLVTFDLELRFGTSARRTTLDVRVGEETPVTLLDNDFESNQGWNATDDGVATRGFWVREDPEGTTDSQSRLVNPEDDVTAAPGTTCWVTGNGQLNGPNNENNNDVDDGAVTLTSPAFGVPHLLSFELMYDRWYYDPGNTTFDTFDAEISNDGGQSWTTLESVLFDFGTWEHRAYDLTPILPPSDDMLLRFIVSDGGSDGTVEGAVDEVRVTGNRVECEDYLPPLLQAPNPVGDSLLLSKHAAGHLVLSWDAPVVDAGHDAPTLYRIETAATPVATFVETGSATSTLWIQVDGLIAPGVEHFLVRGENSGGSE